MPFEPAFVQARSASAGSATGVKASLKKIKTGAAQLTLILTGPAIETLGWKNGESIEVLLGNGEQHGLLRLRLVKKGKGQVVVAEKVFPLGKKSYQIIRLGHQPAFVDRAEKAQPCQWEIVEDAWLEVVLPKWADETSPAKRAKALLPSRHDNHRHLAPPQTAKTCVPAYEPRRPGRLKRNVTSEMMGDPPPGRREAVEKIAP